MSKHPIPDWLRSRFSRIEDEVQKLGPCGVFTQMRTVTQTYFEQLAAAPQMTRGLKLVPVRREVLEQAAHWLHVHHNGPSAETNAADDLLEAIRINNAEKHNPCQKCSGTGEARLSGHSDACNECRGSGRSAAPQPTAPGVGATLKRYDMSGFGDGMVETEKGAFSYFDDVAPLQAEIERLTDSLANHDSVSKVMNAWVAEKGQMPWATAIKTLAIITKMPDQERDQLLNMDDGSTERGALIEERDQLKARRDELEAKLTIYESFPGYLIDHCEGATVYEESLQHWLAEHIAALSKPAKSDSV